MSAISFIIENIKKNGQCKTIALSNSGAVAIFGKNGYAYSGIPNGMIEELSHCYNAGVSIDEVTLKDDGSWAIISNDNHDAAGLKPKQINAACAEAVRCGTRIYSVDWIRPFFRNEDLCLMGVDDLSAINVRELLECRGGGPAFFSQGYYRLERKNTYAREISQPFSHCMKESETKWGFCETISLGIGDRSFHVIEYNKRVNIDYFERDDLWLGTTGGYLHSRDLDQAINERDASKVKDVYFDNIDGSDPLYAVVKGIVSKPYRLKLFSGNRYFVSNEDGTQYYYYL